jgi:DNA-binding MarR family transcriptional regulator
LVIEKSPVRENFQNMLDTLALDIKGDVSTLEGRTFRLVCFVSDIVNRYLDIQLEKWGINRTNYDILHVLVVNKGSLTPTELGKYVFRSKHAVTRAIDVLEREGLVIRRPHDSPDRRLKKVNVTEKGLSMLKDLQAKRVRMHQQFLSCFNEVQMEELGTPLRQLREHLLKQINKS